MAPFIWIMGLSLRVARGQWLPLISRALLLLFATFCFITAIRVMPLADALAIVFVAPFIVLLFGKFYLGEDVGPRRIGACIVGFAGVLFVIQPSFAAFGAVALIPLGTAVAFAFYILVTRGLSRRMHPVALQFHTGFIASLFCIPMLLLAQGSGSLWCWILRHSEPYDDDLCAVVSTLSHTGAVAVFRVASSDFVRVPGFPRFS